MQLGSHKEPPSIDYEIISHFILVYVMNRVVYHQTKMYFPENELYNLPQYISFIF